MTTAKTSPRRMRRSRSSQPTFFLCDACGRVYNTTQMSRQEGVCVNCDLAHVKPTGRSFGAIVAVNPDGRIYIPNPPEARSRPTPSSQELEAQEDRAAEARRLNARNPNEQ